MAPKTVAPLVPETEREWRLYRRGFVEGVTKSQQDAACAAEAFRIRAFLAGVELEFPAAPGVQTSAPKRRRVS